MDKYALWLTGALVLGLIAALQSTAAAFLMDFRQYYNKRFYTKLILIKICDGEKERLVARLSMLLIFLAALYLATFAKPAMILFGGIAIFNRISVYHYIVRNAVVSLDHKRGCYYGYN